MPAAGRFHLVPAGKFQQTWKVSFSGLTALPQSLPGQTRILELGQNPCKERAEETGGPESSSGLSGLSKLLNLFDFPPVGLPTSELQDCHETVDARLYQCASFRAGEQWMGEFMALTTITVFGITTLVQFSLI